MIRSCILLCVALMLAAVARGPALGDDRIDRLVAATSRLPSVHMEPAEIDAALAEGGVPRDTLDRLWRDVDRAILPGMGSRLDGFLFMTRDPEWLAIRDRFAEFLTLPDVTGISDELVASLAAYDGFVSLPGVTTLADSSAAALAAFGGDSWAAAIELPGVSRLTADEAASLAECPALVVLTGLRELPSDAAAALARHRGIGLVIGGLATLPPDVAEPLAGCRSLQGMLLPDLVRLDSPALAARLARQDNVFLPKVTTLTPEVASALRGNQGGSLGLPGLTTLDTATAERLAGSGYFEITLGSAAMLTPETAAAISRHPGPLIFTGPDPFSLEAARALATHPGDIVLRHVAALSADVAAALAPHGHLLVLPGVTALDTAAATALAAHRGGLCLPGLRRLTPQAAAVLRERSGVEMPAGDDLEIEAVDDIDERRP